MFGGPQGAATNIPPSIDEDLTTGLGLGICRIQIPSVGTLPVTEESSSTVQQQVPLVSGSAPPNYTRHLHESSASALNCSLHISQSSHDIQCCPELSPGTAPDAPCLHWGEWTGHSDPTLSALREGVSTLSHRGWKVRRWTGWSTDVHLLQLSKLHLHHRIDLHA